MVAINRLLTGRGSNNSKSRTVTGATSVGASDLNNEIVFDSVSTAVITFPSGNALGASIDDAVYVYIKNTGVPTFTWTGGTIRVPGGLPAGIRYGYLAVKWSPENEWVQV